jgi:magnesium-transporting ATPase (P-type)
VLVVATPCPLILATPIAFVAGISRSAKRGIIVRNGNAIEQLGEARSFIFDKTGTLTLGVPTVTDVESYATDAKHVRCIAASLDQFSAFVQRVTLVNVTGFAGDVSATIQVGDGTTVNRYNTGTPSVFATATAIDTGAVSGTAIHIIANTVRLTVTTSTDFTLAVTNGTGQLTVRVYYFN